MNHLGVFVYVAMPRFKKNDFFCFKFIFLVFWIVLMYWCKKKKKNIILMHLQAKSTLKSNRYHNIKHYQSVIKFGLAYRSVTLRYWSIFNLKVMKQPQAPWICSFTKIHEVGGYIFKQCKSPYLNNMFCDGKETNSSA